MLVDQACDEARAEETSPPGTLVEQRAAKEIGQLATEPPAERHAEAGLASDEDGWRQQPLDGTLEDQLAPRGVPLEGARDARRELDQRMVQQRAAYFQAVGHRGDV